ncbi:MAG: AI-2E family transporter YdiK [Syntrophales bacterium]|nr:AI-2E family transporter YdiK [Syntrophales bacterium]
MREPNYRDITHSTLTVLLIAILIVAVFGILRPFIPALVWATTIVVTTWPVLLRVQAWLWGKRGLATLVMTVALLLVLVIPCWIALATIIDNAHRIDDLAESLRTSALPPPPSWVQDVPMIGPKLSTAWQEVATAGPEGVISWIKPYSGKVAKWFVDQAGNLGKILVQFLLTVIISAILYTRGDTAAAGIRRFARRLGGHRSEEVTILAGKAIRGVALGVVVTALAQSFLGGIGLAVTGVPSAAVLTAVMFMLCAAQLGPGLVLIPAVIWLFWGNHNMAGSVLLVWTVIVTSLDNVLRPMLIRKGADLPLLLVFAGVIGGLIAFGIVGIFIGPVVLAVAFTLLKAWVEEEGADLPEGL